MDFSPLFAKLLTFIALMLAGYAGARKNIISHAMYVAKREKLVKKGDLVVFTAGDPATNVITGEGAMTNIMQVIQAK